jgi:hypothetical protein
MFRIGVRGSMAAAPPSHSGSGWALEIACTLHHAHAHAVAHVGSAPVPIAIRLGLLYVEPGVVSPCYPIEMCKLAAVGAISEN